MQRKRIYHDSSYDLYSLPHNLQWFSVNRNLKNGSFCDVHRPIPRFYWWNPKISELDESVCLFDFMNEQTYIVCFKCLVNYFWRRRNKIEFLNKKDENYISQIEEIEGCFVNYFENLFKISILQFHEEAYRLMQPSIIREESTELIRVSKEKRIKETICKMGFLKALELVGMPSLLSRKA